MSFLLSLSQSLFHEGEHIFVAVGIVHASVINRKKKLENFIFQEESLFLHKLNIAILSCMVRAAPEAAFTFEWRYYEQETSDILCKRIQFRLWSEAASRS